LFLELIQIFIIHLINHQVWNLKKKKTFYIFFNFIGELNPTPWTNYPTPTYDQQQNDLSSTNSGGVWGWISNNKMLATVVEKAKVIYRHTF
jgi:hypothetical protein